MAVMEHSEDQLRKAVLKNPNLVNEANSCGQTPLHLAIGWPLGVKILMDSKADLELKNMWDDRPLCCAIKMRDTESVLLLG